jgi:hypothetical protein
VITGAIAPVITIKRASGMSNGPDSLPGLAH